MDLAQWLLGYRPIVQWAIGLWAYRCSGLLASRPIVQWAYCPVGNRLSGLLVQQLFSSELRA